MTFRAFFAIQADGGQARSELDRTERATRQLGRAADGAEAQVDGLAAAERRAAVAAQGIQRSHALAAGSVGNLTAQFNDIGVMMAAGQNPLQLALQQGTQITQVLGPMGAGQAVRALGRAFLSLLSPINLVTIGAIAAGGFVVRWLTGAGDEAENFEDSLASLSEQMDSFRDLTDRSASDLRATFGGLTADIVQMHREMQALSLERLLLDANKIGDALAEGIDPQELRRAFQGVDRRAARTGRNDLFDELKAEIGEIGGAVDVDAQIAAVERLQETLKAASGDISAMTEDQRAFYGLTLDALAKLREIRALQDLPADNANAQSLEFLTASLDTAIARGEAEAANRAEAEAMLTALEQQNVIGRAVLRNGEDSARVAALRNEAARAQLDAELEALGVTGELADEIRRAFEENLALANIDVASGIGAAANEASRLANNLLAAAHFAEQAAAMQAASPADPGGTGGLGFGGGAVGDPSVGDAALGFGNFTSNPRRTVIDLTPPTFASRGGGGGGGSRGGGGRGRSSARAEHDEVAELIAAYEEELDLLRETDPVQQELLRNRDVLAEATEAEREAVEGLIRGIEAEKAALEQVEFFRDTAYDAVAGLILQGQTLEETFQNVALAIAEAGLKAALLGEGPLAGLFGTSDSGGFLGGLLGDLLPGLAGGGEIGGPGTGNSDSVLLWGSTGEFMVNADATARYRDLLEFINAGGDLPGYAFGGAIGGASAREAGFGSLAPTAPGQTNVFNIATQDARSFAQSRASSARAASRFMRGAGRYS